METLDSAIEFLNDVVLKEEIRALKNKQILDKGDVPRWRRLILEREIVQGEARAKFAKDVIEFLGEE